MMVKIVDVKGKERYVNAAYIKSVTPKGSDRSDIDFGHWGGSIRVDQPAEQVAEVVNASLPSSFDEYLAAIDQQGESNNSASVATTIAIIG